MLLYYYCTIPDLFTRPQYTVFPHDSKGFSIDEQYYIGDSGLLVRPVTQKGVTETKVYLAEDRVRASSRGINTF